MPGNLVLNNSDAIDIKALKEVKHPLKRMTTKEVKKSGRYKRSKNLME